MRTLIAALEAAPLRLHAWYSEDEIPRGERGLPAAVAGFIFLHAVGLSYHSWLPAARLVGRQRPALALTLAGFGESDLAPDDDYSLRTQAARVVAFALQAGLERWVLVGNSLGAAIAMAAATAEPERTAGLVLVNAAVYRRGLPRVGWFGCLPGMDRLLGVVPSWGLGAAMVVGSGRRGWVKAEHGRRCREALRRPGGSRAFVLSLRALYGPELDLLGSVFAGIRCPALVLRGERDPLIPAWVSERLASELPDARLEFLPRLSHFAQEEGPALVAEHCLCFAGRLVP
jgi:pimeloyl-ACP methyl ester carboxylesterase